MFRNRLYNFIKYACRTHAKIIVIKVRHYVPVTMGLLTTVHCDDDKRKEVDILWEETLGHEFLIRQATTVNVNAATQLLTVTLVAIQDTSERLRDALTKEICLVKQALEWGEDGTPPHHWDQLVAIRGTLCDLKHNLQTLFSYMDYAEKLATVAAEISYLSGNIAASDAICERIDHACRDDLEKINEEVEGIFCNKCWSCCCTCACCSHLGALLRPNPQVLRCFSVRSCNIQKQLTHELQQECLELQQHAIISSPQLENKLKH